MTTIIRRIKAHIAKILEEVEQLQKLQDENYRLRYLLAKGNDPCIYCNLSKADMIRCTSGFPGCGRADDLFLGDDL